MTVLAAFCPLSLQTLFDINGAPLRGAKIYVYDAGTSQSRVVYRDAGMARPYPMPFSTDAYGRVPPFWVGLGDYKVAIRDANNAAVGSEIDGLAGGGVAASSTSTATAIQTGMVMAAHTDDVFDGWLPLNAKTIGSSTSSATGRANDDVLALYTKLWNKDPGLAVTGGRGVSASADWAAAKPIALPDYRGRVLVGCDSMGSTAAGILTSATTATPNQVGTKFGTEGYVLTGAQLPAIAPAITVAGGGGFSSTVSTDSQGTHTHGGTTDIAGSHSHNYQHPNSGIPYGATGTDPTPAANNDFTATTNTTGDHTHTFTTASAGAHTHSVTVSQSNHSHTATIANLGSGNAHPNMQPSVLGYWHIKI